MISIIPTAIVKCFILTMMVYMADKLISAWALALFAYLGIFWIVKDIEMIWKLNELKSQSQEKKQ